MSRRTPERDGTSATAGDELTVVTETPGKDSGSKPSVRRRPAAQAAQTRQAKEPGAAAPASGAPDATAGTGLDAGPGDDTDEGPDDVLDLPDEGPDPAAAAAALRELWQDFK